MRLSSCLVFSMLALGTGFAEESPQQEPAVKPEFQLRRTDAETFRERFQDAPPCQPVPMELFHPAPVRMKELIPPDASLAGAGSFLAVLVAQPKEETPNEGVYQLRWFENYDLVLEQVLQPSKELPFRRDGHSFEVSRGGKAIAFQTAAGMVVFSGAKQGAVYGQLEAKGARFALSERELIWCLSPQGLMVHHQKEALPICSRGSFKNASSEELLVLDEKPKTLGPHGEASKYVLLPALRRDSKLWFVNVHTGEVLLTSAVGTEISRWVLPYRMETNPEVMSHMQQIAQQKIAELEAKERDFQEMSGGKPPTFEVKIVVPLIAEVATRDNELVMFTASQRKPANAVFWLSEDLKESRCFLLPELSAKAGGAVSAGWRKKVVVADDALWVAEPLGYYLWDELLSEGSPSP